MEANRARRSALWPLTWGRGGPEGRSGRFADSGQSTRTGSGERRRRREAQRERLTDPGSDQDACAARDAQVAGAGAELSARWEAVSE